LYNSEFKVHNHILKCKKVAYEKLKFKSITVILFRSIGFTYSYVIDSNHIFIEIYILLFY